MLTRFRLCIALVLVAGVAQADKASDFKDAAAQGGCDSIPYGDLRSTCRSQQNEVHPWCDGDHGAVSCDSGGTGNLRSSIVREQQTLDALARKREDAENNRYHATDDAERAKWAAEKDAVGKDIDASQRRLDDLRDQLSKRKDVVNRTLDTINKCIDYRQAVMNIFDAASERGRTESGDDVKPYAQQLRDRYAAEVGGHKVQIAQRTSALTTCKAEMP